VIANSSLYPSSPVNRAPANPDDALPSYETVTLLAPSAKMNSEK